MMTHTTEELNVTVSKSHQEASDIASRLIAELASEREINEELRHNNGMELQAARLACDLLREENKRLTAELETHRRFMEEWEARQHQPLDANQDGGLPAMLDYLAANVPQEDS